MFEYDDIRRKRKTILEFYREMYEANKVEFVSIKDVRSKPLALRISCDDGRGVFYIVHYKEEDLENTSANSLTENKQTMFCVYSPWGYHRCYTMKLDAQEDADKQNKKDHLMGHSVIECEVTIKPNYDNPS